MESAYLVSVQLILWWKVGVNSLDPELIDQNQNRKWIQNEVFGALS